MRKKIACLLGTRPEVIKMAPVIFMLLQNENVGLSIICTAQHRKLLDDMLKTFAIEPDIDLNLMQDNQTISQLTSALCFSLENIASNTHYDAWLVQGDTTTAFAASLVAFYHKIPIGHIEAGLRSGDRYQPFPEEMNRLLISQLATWHFVPTFDEKKNLLQEGIQEKGIFITGNTVIDALYWIIKNKKPTQSFAAMGKFIVVTSHRRENFGVPLQNICQALKTIVATFPELNIIYPVHPNPNVKKCVHKALSGVARIHLIPALEYNNFIHLLQNAYLILTDSGGIQEEASALGKPVLILRNKTERPQVIKAGIGVLVGTEPARIVNSVRALLQDQAYYKKIVQAESPYGDGQAAEKIVAVLQDCLIN